MKTLNFTTAKGNACTVTFVEAYSAVDMPTLKVNGVDAFETDYKGAPAVDFAGRLLKIEGELEVFMNETYRPAMAEYRELLACMNQTGFGPGAAKKVLTAVADSKATGQTAVICEKPGVVNDRNGESPATIRYIATPTGLQIETVSHH